MGFNYLQTDDRDDYLSQFVKKPRTRIVTGITLISPSGEILFNNEPMFRIRTYCKNQYLPYGKGAKKIWRKILESKGYEVITNIEDV